MTYTKGPWEFREGYFGEEELVAVQSGDSVARAAWTGGSGCELRIEKEADRRLIAAAPELVEALRGLLEHSTSTGMVGDQFADDARALLAKIDGEQP